MLGQWCKAFAEKNKNNHNNATLTPDEISSWLAAVYEFQQYYAGTKPSVSNDIYDAPVDEDLLSIPLLSLWNMATDCQQMEIIIKPVNRFSKDERIIKW